MKKSLLGWLAAVCAVAASWTVPAGIAKFQAMRTEESRVRAFRAATQHELSLLRDVKRHVLDAAATCGDTGPAADMKRGLATLSLDAVDRAIAPLAERDMACGAWLALAELGTSTLPASATVAMSNDVQQLSSRVDHLDSRLEQLGSQQESCAQLLVQLATELRDPSCTTRSLSAGN